MLTPEQVDRAVKFAGAVLVYCDRFRGSVTSWYRTPLHNVAVGGVPLSPHLLGVGADVKLDAPVPLSARLGFAARLGLKLIDEHDHDHLQLM